MEKVRLHCDIKTDWTLFMSHEEVNIILLSFHLIKLYSYKIHKKLNVFITGSRLSNFDRPFYPFENFFVYCNLSRLVIWGCLRKIDSGFHDRDRRITTCTFSRNIFDGCNNFFCKKTIIQILTNSFTTQQFILSYIQNSL